MARILLVLLALLTAPAARDARPAARPERAAIARAGLAYADRTVPNAARYRFVVSGIRVSTVDARFAAARIAARDAQGRPALDTVDAVFRRRGRDWTLIDLGTAEVGCGTLAPDVEADLLGAGACP